MTDQTYQCGCGDDPADPTCPQHGHPRAPRVLAEGWVLIDLDGTLIEADDGPWVFNEEPDTSRQYPSTIRVRLVEVVEP